MVRSVVARIGLAVGALTAGFSPVLAQDECAPVIQSLTQTVLDGREALPPLQARRFGTRAIYLQMRYGALDEATAERLLDEAVAARMHGAEDLQLAWRFREGGAVLGAEDVASAIDTALPSAMRALVTSGQADSVMAGIAAAPDNQRVQLGQMLVTVSFDQPDSVKAELVAMAADHDLGWWRRGWRRRSRTIMPGRTTSMA